MICTVYHKIKCNIKYNVEQWISTKDDRLGLMIALLFTMFVTRVVFLEVMTIMFT